MIRNGREISRGGRAPKLIILGTEFRLVSFRGRSGGRNPRDIRRVINNKKMEGEF